MDNDDPFLRHIPHTQNSDEFYQVWLLCIYRKNAENLGRLNLNLEGVGIYFLRFAFGHQLILFLIMNESQHRQFCTKIKFFFIKKIFNISDGFLSRFQKVLYFSKQTCTQLGHDVKYYSLPILIVKFYWAQNII